MYLKKLELTGFKSFVDKTEFVFGSGLTGIVGPNGCGKSNVVDAFKWIFGEQSAKGLRGSEMKDVIFNGTQARKAAGFAEVTVVFDNADRFFDVDFSEVAITRRLFRSGESEYLINRQRCRLRDIKDLLLDTGIGSTSYSIFEQGKIDVLLQANPQDRRIIFEEAAGISKYRARKAESLRALQRVEDNLARLGDVVSELEKRHRRVKAQAGKARRYREYSDRLRDLRIRLAVEDYRSSMTERAELTCERFLLDHDIEQLEGTWARLREGLERTTSERSEKAAALRRLREELSETRSHRERLEESIRHNRRRLDDLGVELERKRAAVESTRDSISGGREELERERQGVSALSLELEQRRALLSLTMETLETLRREHEALRERSEALKREVVACMEEQSRLGNQLVQIDSELLSLEARRGRIENQLAGAREERAEVESRRGALLEGVERDRTEIAGLERRRDQTADELAGIDGEVVALQGRLKELHGEIEGARSRLEVLTSFEESLDGVSQGVADIVREHVERPGVHDLLARLIEVPPIYVPAVEAVLGARSQALVVDSEEGAMDLLEAARDLGGCAVEVFPLDRVTRSEAVLPVRARGVVGFLRDHVTVGPRYAELLDRLLAGVLVVEDLDLAREISRGGLGDYTLVTLDGELLESTGAVAMSGDTSTGLISRRSEMQSLEDRLRELDREADEREIALDRLVVAREEREELMADLVGKRDRLSRRLAAAESQVEQIERELERLGRTIEVGLSEIQEIDAEIASRSAEKRELEVRQRETLQRREEREATSRDLEERMEAHGRKVHQTAEQVTEAKVAHAESVKREEGLRRAIGQLEHALEEREAHERSLAGEIEELDRRRDGTASDLASAEESLGQVRASEQSRVQSVDAAEAEDEEIARVEKAFRVELESIRTSISERAARREKVNLKDQEGVLRRNGALEKISEEYGIDLLEVLERIGEEEPLADPPGAGEQQEGAGTDRVSDLGEEPSGGERPGQPSGELQAVTIAPASDGGEAGPSGEAETAAEADFPILSGLGGDDETGAGEDEPLELRLRHWLTAGDDEGWDRTDASEEIRDVQQRIRQLGNVNMEALEELEEIKERLDFQVSQRDDLLRAERDLRQIIGEINKTSRELFTNTFETVQKNFGELFQKCFGGGKAELVLDEGVDILESGIDIVARPPGKKLTSLSLMSGGEKTMTTIALMFSIFRARPSPFCILDEVDAPLDENNVRRFVVLVKEFMEQSQFIIITHNKITMAVAHRLYGVTMQERGVSKRVAVEFEKYDPDNPHESMSTGDIDAAPLVEAGPGPSGGDTEEH